VPPRAPWGRRLCLRYSRGGSFSRNRGTVISDRGDCMAAEIVYSAFSRNSVVVSTSACAGAVTTHRHVPFSHRLANYFGRRRQQRASVPVPLLISGALSLSSHLDASLQQLRRGATINSFARRQPAFATSGLHNRAIMRAEFSARCQFRLGNKITYAR